MSKIQTTKPLLVTLSTILFFNSAAYAAERNRRVELLGEVKTCYAPFSQPDANAQIVPFNKQQITQVLDSKEFYTEWIKLNRLSGNDDLNNVIVESATRLGQLSSNELTELNNLALRLGLFSPKFLVGLGSEFGISDVVEALENKHYFFTRYQTRAMREMISSSKLKKKNFLDSVDNLEKLLSKIRSQHPLSTYQILHFLLLPYKKATNFTQNDISKIFKNYTFIDVKMPWFINPMFIMAFIIGSIMNGSTLNGSPHSVTLFTLIELAMLFAWPSIRLGEATIKMTQNTANYRRATKRSAALYSSSQFAMLTKHPLQKIGDTQNNYLNVPNEIKTLPGRGANSVFAESYTFKSVKRFLEELEILTLPKISTNYESVGKLATDINFLKAQSEYLFSIAASALTEASALGSKSCRADSLCVEHDAIIRNVINTQTDTSNKTKAINDHINFAQIVLNDLTAATTVLDEKIAHLEKSLEAGRSELQRFSSAPNSVIVESALSALAEDIKLLKTEQTEMSKSYVEIREFIKKINKLR